MSGHNLLNNCRMATASANHEGLIQRKNGRFEAALTYRNEAGEVKRRRSYHHSREDADKAFTKMKSGRDGAEEHEREGRRSGREARGRERAGEGHEGALPHPLRNVRGGEG